MVGEWVDQATAVMGRWVVVQSVRVEMAWFWWRGNFMSWHAVRKIPQVVQNWRLCLLIPLPFPDIIEFMLPIKLLKHGLCSAGRWGGTIWGSLEVGEFWRLCGDALIRLAVSANWARPRTLPKGYWSFRHSSLPLPSEVAIIEHFLAVGVQSPVFPFP